MPSLRQHPRSPFWIACITKRNGVRTTRSTGVLVNASSREERKERKERALEMATKWERLGRKSGLDADQVREVVNDILRASGAEMVDTITPRQFFAEWVAGKHKSSTRERYQVVADRFLQAVRSKADDSMVRINYEDVLSYIRAHQKNGAASKTVLVEAKILNAAFNLAQRLGHITTNPVAKALALQQLKSTSSTKSIFTLEQISQLVGVAGGEWKTVVLVGYYTGARLRDCTNLPFSQIDFEKQILTLKQCKTGKTVWIPLHPDLAEHLLARRLQNPDATLVTPTLAGRKTGGKSGLSKEFSALMRAANIDPGVQPGQGRRKFSALSFHSLRHSFNSQLANAGVDQETRMALTGQTSVQINRDYTHLDFPKLSRAIGTLGSLPQGSAPETAPNTFLEAGIRSTGHTGKKLSEARPKGKTK